MTLSIVWTRIPGPQERVSVSPRQTSLTSAPSYMESLIRDCYGVIRREQELFIKEIFKKVQGVEGLG